MKEDDPVVNAGITDEMKDQRQQAIHPKEQSAKTMRQVSVAVY